MHKKTFGKTKLLKKMPRERSQIPPKTHPLRGDGGYILVTEKGVHVHAGDKLIEQRRNSGRPDVLPIEQGAHRGWPAGGLGCTKTVACAAVHIDRFVFPRTNIKTYVKWLCKTLPTLPNDDSPTAPQSGLEECFSKKKILWLTPEGHQSTQHNSWKYGRPQHVIQWIPAMRGHVAKNQSSHA